MNQQSPMASDRHRSILLFILLLVLLFILQACTSIPVAQRTDKREQLNKEAEETIAQMVEQDPGIQQELEEAAGYFVSRVSAANVAVIGGGHGIGVLVDNQSGDRAYLNVKRFDFGAGLGVRYFRVLLIVKQQEKLDSIRDGWTFRGVATDVAAGSRGNESTSQAGEGFSVHILSESGASITATARRVRLSVNRDLTDTGLSEISIPNIKFEIEDGRAETEKRWWDHKMPFLAQKVIDKGYDLPLPYGLKLAYVNVDQEQLLTDLWVGFNGSEKVPLDWVEFENARSENDSVQLIFDTWVFPFMNVFAILVKIDGQAPVDVLIEGNGFLDQLGIDCSRPGNVLACNLFQDKDFVLPITANFEGNSYGIGVNLAGGWKGFFATLPMSWVYADMKNSDTNGAVFSASPRVGKVFNLKNMGNLALYFGGSYLDSDLTATGSYPVPAIDEDFTIDYRIDQKNKDKWNTVVGANWDINSRWSLQAAYNGFTGSRETWMGTISWRF
jgi:lipid-binding SYLF domain-containing protein